MLVCRLLFPPVTMMSPFGNTATPGQNMSCAVLLISRGLTWPVVRSKIAVCVCAAPREDHIVWFEDHTSSLLFGNSAAATGTSGNPIVGPHWPTSEGSVLNVGGLTGASTDDAPCSEIPATATEVPEPAANDRAVSRTKRVVTGWIPMCFLFVVLAHVPDAAGVKCTPSALTLISNRPITPAGRLPCRGSYATSDTVCGPRMSIVIDCWMVFVADADGLLFQYVSESSSSTASAGWPADSLLACTVHPAGCSVSGVGLLAAAGTR